MLNARMFNRQSYTSQKTIFCHFTQHNCIIRNDFHLFQQNCIDKHVFKNRNRINHSSPMNNTVQRKIEHFPQLFALGTQIALKSN